MAEDRARGHAAVGSDEEIHDDDELAAALAAELERIAPTGAVPVLRGSAVPFGPVSAPSEAPPAPMRPQPQPRPGAAGPQREAPRPEAPVLVPASAAESAAAIRPSALAPRSARRPPSPVAVAEPGDHHRHAETAARHAGRRPGRSAPPTTPSPVIEDEQAVERRTVAAPVVEPPAAPAPAQWVPAFSTTGEHRTGEPAPGRRRAADAEPPRTQPVRIPDAARSSGPVAAGPEDLQDPLRETGPLALAPTLYESWERSLRSIGRPWTAEETAFAAVHSDPDAPTVAIPRAALGPLPDEPVTSALAPEPAVPDGPAAEPGRRRGGRRARGADADATPTTAPAAVAATPDPEWRAAPPEPPVAQQQPEALAALRQQDEEADGLDEVDTGIRAVSAADTAAVPLPPMIEPSSPVTGGVPTAGASTTHPERPFPIGGPSLLSSLLLWCGAFASPVLLLAGFALAAAGAGGAAAGALVLGVAVAVPAAVRLAAAAEADRIGSPALAARLFGPRGGPFVAAVLLAARLLGAALALLGVADLAGGFVARTGVGDASTSAASVAAVVVAGLGATVAAVWPRRITRIVLGTLAVVALVVTVAVLLLTAPAVAVAVPTAPPSGTAPLAGVVGFGVLGLLLAATVADATRTASGRGRGRGAPTAVVLSAIAGLVVLVLALAVGRGAGATGDPAAAFSGVIADATPAALAGPLALVLLLAALPLPGLLIATAGDTAAVLIGAGRSARLGAVAAGLVALAVALVLLAGGLDASVALATIGAVLGVPVAVWAGVATLSSLRSGAGRSAQQTLVWASAIATIAGWLLADGLGTAAERSPILDALRMPADSVWRGSPALGLLLAFVFGLVAAVVARIATARAAAPPASRLRSGRRQAVDSVEG